LILDLQNDPSYLWRQATSSMHAFSTETATPTATWLLLLPWLWIKNGYKKGLRFLANHWLWRLQGDLNPCCRRERRVTGFRIHSQIAWNYYKYWHCAKTVESVLGWFFPYLGTFLRENYPKHTPVLSPRMTPIEQAFSYLNCYKGFKSFSREWTKEGLWDRSIIFQSHQQRNRQSPNRDYLSFFHRWAAPQYIVAALWP
jgi:hypothetical protein